jgi:hypothetical protein
MLKKLIISVICLFFILLLSKCPPQDGETENPVPGLTAISPAAEVAHLLSFSLTATGTEFVPGGQIVFNGQAQPTSYVSATQLTCQIEPDDTLLPIAGSQSGNRPSTVQDETVPVLVRNPSPGGGDSNSLDFTIYSNPAFTYPQDIGGTEFYSGRPTIGVDNSGHVSVAWNEICHVCTNDFLWVYFNHSADYGSTWDTAQKISGDLLDVEDPKIAVDASGSINVCWWEESQHPDPTIFGNFRRSEDQGTTWGDIINVSTISNWLYGPAMAVDNDNTIYMIWRGIYYEYMYFSYSTDGAATWVPAINIPKANASWRVSYITAVAVDEEGHIFVVWREESGWYDQAIYFSRSSNFGATWSTAQDISQNPADSKVYRVAMACDTYDNIYVVWRYEYGGQYKIQFNVSRDDGGTWGQPLDLFDVGISYSIPVVAADALGNVNLAWPDNVPGITDIYFSRSLDNGANWTQPVNVSNTNINSSRPDIAVDGSGKIYIVWEDSIIGKGEILFTTTPGS